MTTDLPKYGPEADPDRTHKPLVKPFLLTLDDRSTDEVKDHWPALHLPKLKKDRDGLRWAFRSVHPDLTSTHGYRWPFPGHWAEATGPFTVAGGMSPACPSAVGDGLCLARTLAGAASGQIKATTGLICAYLESDLLGSDGDKWRVKRTWVGEVIATITELLGYANLRGADLGYANLGYADLGYANLGYANLGYADLGYANLRGADLGYADLRGANLGYADLRYANLRGADLGYANLRYADLRGANLGYANLGYADLRYANLRGADLGYADLRYANLRGADLGYADLRGADLRGADYSQLTLWPEGFSPSTAGAVLI
jgi:uncharacterized protein YjbI with pentapeptide repeats